MQSLLQDLRHSFRLMRRAPGFTLAALVTLALAVGANTAVFSVVYGVLLRPLPYRHAERIVALSEDHPGGVSVLRDPRLSNLTFDTWREHAQTIDAMSAYANETFTVRTGNESERVNGASLSPSAFAVLGVTPSLGRFFTDDEAVEGRAEVVVLSDSAWRSRFNADPAVAGKTIEINGRVHEIVGVAPAWFYFPDRDALLWKPYVPPLRQPGSMRVMSVIARLKPGVSVEQAAAEGTAAARGVTRPMAAELLFGKGGPVEVRVQTLSALITRRVRPALVILMAAVALVLLIACANVANLLLARGTARGRELAVRAALGAAGRRLARQLLTESAAIGLAGGGLGVFLAWVLTRALPAWAPEGFPRLDEIGLDRRALGFAFFASLLAGTLAGVVPAWRASRTELASALRSGDTRSIGAGERARSVLLALEAALSVMLLVGAALLLRSFAALVNVDPGYSAANVLTGRIYLAGAASTPERRLELLPSLTGRLRATPGVAAAGIGNMAPLGESSFVSGFSFGTNAAGQPVVARALQYVVTAGYAEALGLRLREGRLIQVSDEGAAVQAMLVNEAFARAYMNDGKPIIGRRYEGLLHDGRGVTEIVGVLGDVLKDGLDGQAQPEIYVAVGREHRITREMNVIVRTIADPSAFAPTLRTLVLDIEPTAALGRVGPLTGRIADSVSEPRFATAVLSAFAMLALGIAATGLYGVLSYNVSQRRREIGIRAALGATRRNLIGLVVRQGLAVTACGLALGLIVSAIAARRLQPLLFGIQPLDLPSFAIVPVVLLIVALTACALPARRAAATDPGVTLKTE
jgi:predicted permease